MSTSDALHRVLAGRVDPSAPTHESADALWCRVVAQGRILDQANDGGLSDYRVHLFLVEHPALPIGDVYALFAMGMASFSVYRCTVMDAFEALRDPSAFNL